MTNFMKLLLKSLGFLNQCKYLECTTLQPILCIDKIHSKTKFCNKNIHTPSNPKNMGI